MSYLQIEIGGKLRGLKFSQGTNILLRDKIKNYSDSEKEAFGGHAIVWAALKANALIKDEVVDFTFSDVCDWAEKFTEDDWTKVLAVYNEANPKPDENSDVAEPTAEEKKSTTETTEPNVTDLPVS